MTTRSLDALFAPKSIAVIGASQRQGSVGQSVLRNLSTEGSREHLYAVNPKHKTVNGVPCFPRIGELPDAVDLAVICTPAATVPGLVRECGEADARGIVVLSAGFRETGAAGQELEAATLAEAQKFPGLRLLGPNCLGFMSPHRALSVSFVEDLPPRGRVAFVSQSGALCSAVLDWAKQEKVGFSFFVSLGNMLDVGFDDLIDYLGSDPWTDSIILYVESITKARRFMSAARAFTRTKPIVAYKAGRFAESAKAAASHTGAMAGVDSVYEAALNRAGVVRVSEIDDLFDCAELLAHHKTPQGPRLAIVTNAGGPGVIATDALLARRGSLAKLSNDAVCRLNQCLPAAWSHTNPIDILGDATPERFAAAVKIVLQEEPVDGVLVILSPQAMTDPSASARAVVDAVNGSLKPLVAAWMGGARVSEGMQLFAEAGIAAYPSPERAVRAFTYLVAYGRNREVLYETPRDVPLEFSLPSLKRQTLFPSDSGAAHDVLSEVNSKSLLQAYGIPVTQALVAHSEQEVLDASSQVGLPVVLKVFSPDITHKTDVGGVELNLSTAAEAAAAYQRIVASAHEHRPQAKIEGVTVQPMVSLSSGCELIIGAKQDPVFGAVLMVGMGGTAAELLQDRALELPPLNERLARRMLQTLRCWPLLEGYRNRPGVNVDRLIEVLIRISYLVADHPEIAELDVNPLLATPGEVIALDARVVVRRQALHGSAKPYSHLAIRPYPVEFTRRVHLKDGSQAILRPIKPEDEPMWHALLQRCSPETIHQRFRYMFKATTHEMATKFCFIDYDREMAIVAERAKPAPRELLGVGRLVADADHTSAEFAILVGDPWQGIGVGSLLTDYCLEISRVWGIRRVQAQTATDNQRMLAMFRHRGFAMNYAVSSDTVTVTKELG
jgi:acetyltransferase